jgi:cytochrome c-type biogenesis protein CcmI
VVIWIAVILLITAVALFVAAPLTERTSGGTSPVNRGEAERREHEHALAVQALRELEFDHAMGKLDAEDYRGLKHKLEIRALAAMGRGEKMPGPSSLHPAAEMVDESHPIAAERVLTVHFCYQCGTKLDQAHNFCPNCLAPRTTAQ